MDEQKLEFLYNQGGFSEVGTLEDFKKDFAEPSPEKLNFLYEKGNFSKFGSSEDFIKDFSPESGIAIISKEELESGADQQLNEPLGDFTVSDSNASTKEGGRERSTAEEEEAGLVNSLALGSARLGHMLSETPKFLYEVAAWPQNVLADLTGNESLRTSSEALAETLNLPDNEISKIYKQAVEQGQAKFEERFDKSLTEYWKDGDYGKFADLLANHVAQSAPVTIGLMATGAAGASRGALTLGGGAVFGATEREELLARGLSEADATAAAFTKGAFEGFFESFGLTKLGPALKDIFVKEGKEAAQKMAKETFAKAYGKPLIKYLGIAAEEGITEAATSFSQNVVDKFSGADPDKDLSEGVVDALIIGIAAGKVFAAPTTVAEIGANRKARKEVGELEEKKKKIEKDLEAGGLKKSSFDALVKNRNELDEEASKILREQAEILNNLEPEKLEEVLNLRNSLNDVNADLEKTGVSEEAKEVLEATKAELESKIEEIFVASGTSSDDLATTTTEATAGEESTPPPLKFSDRFTFFEKGDLKGIKVKQNAIDPKTGEAFSIDIPASTAQTSIKKEVDILTKLKDCLGK